MDLHDKVAVVTGSARRIGACIARSLARRGAAVVINYRTSATDARETVAAITGAGGRALAIAGDMAVQADVDRLLAQTLDAWGRVDVLVANASTFRRTPIDTLSEADWTDLIDNNLHAARRPAVTLGRHMRAHDGGVILTIADCAAERPWRDYLPYSIAKAGVVALTRGLAKDLAPSVRVNAIAPGPMLFPEDYDEAVRQREIERTLLKRPGTPQHIADAVLALIDIDYITGALLPVDGGRGLNS